MTGRTLLAAVLAVCLSSCVATAALIVDPPLPITRRVSVQIIQTAPNSGSPPATVFGDSSQHAAIESRIDTIWAQAGIDVLFLPNVTHYNNTFAYEGNGGNRNSSDLSQIINAAGSVMNPDRYVINMFFVNVVPGFGFTSENTANGIANVGDDGIAQFVGDGLVSWGGGQDVVAKVVAHEIGHNLGLTHTTGNGPNLMSSPNGTTQQLSSSQIETVLRSSFARPFTPVQTLAGDYNRDNQVDAADYAVWRNSVGGSNLAADGNSDGLINSDDYRIWRGNFGARTSGGGQIVSSFIPAPEPTAFAYLTAILTVWMTRRPTRPRS